MFCPPSVGVLIQYVAPLAFPARSREAPAGVAVVRDALSAAVGAKRMAVPADGLQVRNAGILGRPAPVDLYDAGHCSTRLVCSSIISIASVSSNSSIVLAVLPSDLFEVGRARRVIGKEALKLGQRRGERQGRAHVNVGGHVSAPSDPACDEALYQPGMRQLPWLEVQHHPSNRARRPTCQPTLAADAR